MTFYVLLIISIPQTGGEHPFHHALPLLDRTDIVERVMIVTVFHHRAIGFLPRVLAQGRVGVRVPVPKFESAGETLNDGRIPTDILGGDAGKIRESP